MIAAALRRSDAPLLVAVGAVWGTSALFVRLTVEHVPPLWLVSGRVVSGLMVVLAIAAVRRAAPPTPRQWGHLAFLGVVAMAVPWTVLAMVAEHIPTGAATVLAAPLPATTLGIAAAVRLERLDQRRVVGIVAALLGTLVMVTGVPLSGGRLEALLALLGTVVLYALGAVYARRYLQGITASSAVAAQLVVALVVVLPLAVLVEPIPPLSLPQEVWAAWLCLGGLCTGAAFVAYHRLIQRSGPSTAALTTYISPVVGMAAGWLVLGEQLRLGLVLGAAIVLPGVWLARARGDTHRTRAVCTVPIPRPEPPRAGSRHRPFTPPPGDRRRDLRGPRRALARELRDT